MFKLSGEFLRFCAVGTVGFAVDAGVLETLTRLAGWNPYTTRVLSFLIAASVTWLLNRRFTFEVERQSHLSREWLHYVSVNAMGGLVNYGVYALTVHEIVFVRSHLIVGVAAGSVAGLAVNYTASRHLVFAAARK